MYPICIYILITKRRMGGEAETIEPKPTCYSNRSSKFIITDMWYSLSAVVQLISKILIIIISGYKSPSESPGKSAFYHNNDRAVRQEQGETQNIAYRTDCWLIGNTPPQPRSSPHHTSLYSNHTGCALFELETMLVWRCWAIITKTEYPLDIVSFGI